MVWRWRWKPRAGMTKRTPRGRNSRKYGSWRTSSSRARASEMSNGDTFTFEGAGSTKIFTYRWLPSAPIRGVLQVSHGMGEHALRYREPLQPLIDAGIAIYANDHRGHG